MRVSRRDALKTVVATVSATPLLTNSLMAQTAGGPFADPTVRFDAANQHELHPGDFEQPLDYPLTIRPIFVGTFDQVMDEDKHVGEDGAMPRPGTTGLGAFADGIKVGESFHGIAREFFETPEHWSAHGCDPALTHSEAWKNKQEKFLTVERFDSESLPESDKSFTNWGGFPIRLYRIPIREHLKQVGKQGQPTRFYSYANMVPGPLIKMRLGQPAIIRFVNHLEAETSVHLHGGHNPSHSDGFPTFYVLQGKARDYFYPNIYPLYKEDDAYKVDVGEAQSTAWYHDHAMDATAYNVSKGLVGFVPHFSERELKLIHDRVLPGLGPRSCQDVEADGVANGDTTVEHPHHPGFYNWGAEPFYNPYDWPLVLHDKVIDPATNQIAYDQTAHDGYLGDTFFVNDKIRPVLPVKNRRYRFRILDGSNARVFRLRLMKWDDFQRAQKEGITAVVPGPADPNDDPDFGGNHAMRYDSVTLPFLRIGKDSWLWKHALALKSVVLAMANRADLVIDFGAIAEGVRPGEPQDFVLVNTMPQKDGRGPKQKLDDGGDPRVLPLPFDVEGRDRGPELNRPIGLMKFTVYHSEDPDAPTYVDDVDDDSAEIIPSNDEQNRAPTLLMGNHRTILDHEVRVVRQFIFERGKGAWQVNGRFYDPTIANATPCLGEAEEWIFKNGGGGWWHPIHVHLESHQLVSYEKDFDADEIIEDGPDPAVSPLLGRKEIIGNIPEPERIGLHDTQVLGPNTIARIRIRTRTWNGPFVFHCHNLEHEDMRMMQNFEPVAALKGSSDNPEPEPCDPDFASPPRQVDPNIAPGARSHGDQVTWGHQAIGELPWEYPPVPITPAADAGDALIPSRTLSPKPAK